MSADIQLIRFAPELILLIGACLVLAAGATKLSLQSTWVSAVAKGAARRMGDCCRSRGVPRRLLLSRAAARSGAGRKLGKCGSPTRESGLVRDQAGTRRP